MPTPNWHILGERKLTNLLTGLTLQFWPQVLHSLLTFSGNSATFCSVFLFPFSEANILSFLFPSDCWLCLSLHWENRSNEKRNNHSSCHQIYQPTCICTKFFYFSSCFTHLIPNMHSLNGYYMPGSVRNSRDSKQMKSLPFWWFHSWVKDE